MRIRTRERVNPRRPMWCVERQRVQYIDVRPIKLNKASFGLPRGRECREGKDIQVAAASSPVGPGAMRSRVMLD